MRGEREFSTKQPAARKQKRAPLSRPSRVTNTEKRWYVHDVFEEAMAPLRAYLSSSPNDTTYIWAFGTVLSRIPTVLLIPSVSPSTSSSDEYDRQGK
jgi:hypothetical protein